MRLLITGANGMLGHAIMEAFKDWQPIGLDKEKLDITDEKAVLERMGKLKPQIIINCAAYTNVDKAEEEKKLAFKVNAEGVKHLALAASRVGAILVHYSTDYVFDGKKKEGYSEDDIPQSPVNVYGESKLAGEQELQRTVLCKFYLIRTSWLFGPHGKNFVRTIIELNENNSQLKLVRDQWGKPTYTKDLTKATRKLIEDKAPFGIYHLVNESATNWYEFAKAIISSLPQTVYGNKKKGINLLPISSDESPRPAKRPSYSILINTKRPLLRPWGEALNEYLTMT